MPPNAQLTRADYVGFGEIAKARRMAVVNMFTGTKLRFGSGSAKKVGKDLLSSGASIGAAAVKGSAKAVSAPGINDAVTGFISTCSGVDNIQEIADVITSEATKNLIAEVTPVLGVIKSGASMILAGKKVAEDGYHLYKSKEYRTGFFGGDPVAAADGVIMVIKRDLAVHSIDLAQNAAATGGKIAGLFGDGGTASTVGIGLATSLATLGLKLYVLGQEIADMRAGNKRLEKPDDLDLSVFGECPLLGCYLLTCADTSQVGNFFIADIGLPNWQDRFEKMKKTKMDPMLKIATQAIKDSRLQLEGLRADKGTHTEKGYFAKLKSRAMNWIHPTSTVPKARIVGMGSG